jgi:hypothetical protein
MNACNDMQQVLNEYLDGRLNGVEMQRVTAHLKACPGCSAEMQRLSGTQALLTALGPAKVPADLLPRIQMAVARERVRRDEGVLVRWERAWRQTVGDFALQLAGGFASSLLLIGTVALMVGVFVQPVQVRADDQPVGMRTTPRFLYVSNAINASQINTLTEVSVEVAVDESGRAYDYRIVSGPDNPTTRHAIDNMLLFSTFEPARYYDQPVQGVAIVNFDGRVSPLLRQAGEGCSDCEI